MIQRTDHLCGWWDGIPIMLVDGGIMIRAHDAYCVCPTEFYKRTFKGRVAYRNNPDYKKHYDNLIKREQGYVPPSGSDSV